MPKRKKRKKSKKAHSGNMDIALGYRVDALPGRIRRAEFFNTLIAFVEDGEELPEGWKITLRWKNSAKSKWREDEFMNAIASSREGFNKLVVRRLRRDQNR